MNLDKSEIANLGSSLRRIDPSLMKSEGKEPDGERIWYQSREPYFDVVIKKTDDMITWLQITFRGKVIFWRHPHRQPQTGETDEMDVPPQVAYYAASKTIRDGAQINWSLVEAMQEILAQRADDPTLLNVSRLLKSHLAQRPPELD